VFSNFTLSRFLKVVVIDENVVVDDQK
jgi:hypothetical protein